MLFQVPIRQEGHMDQTNPLLKFYNLFVASMSSGSACSRLIHYRVLQQFVDLGKYGHFTSKDINIVSSACLGRSLFSLLYSLFDYGCQQRIFPCCEED
jgi:hypothetical protein